MSNINDNYAPRIKTEIIDVAGYKVRHKTHPSGAVSTHVHIDGHWTHLPNNAIGKPNALQVVRLIDHFC